MPKSKKTSTPKGKPQTTPQEIPSPQETLLPEDIRQEIPTPFPFPPEIKEEFPTSPSSDSTDKTSSKLDSFLDVLQDMFATQFRQSYSNILRRNRCQHSQDKTKGSTTSCSATRSNISRQRLRYPPPRAWG